MAPRTSLRSSLVPLLLGLMTLCVAASVSAHNAFLVNLKNGTTLISKYKPVTASFDESYMLIMTSAGNTIALDKNEIESIVSDLENRGFGVVIDLSTVVVGRTANDSSEIQITSGQSGTFSDLQSMLQMQNTANGMNQLMGNNQAPGFGGASFDGATTNAPSGGIPLNFVGTPIVPMDGSAPPN